MRARDIRTLDQRVDVERPDPRGEARVQQGKAGGDEVEHRMLLELTGQRVGQRVPRVGVKMTGDVPAHRPCLRQDAVVTLNDRLEGPHDVVVGGRYVAVPDVVGGKKLGQRVDVRDDPPQRLRELWRLETGINARHIPARERSCIVRHVSLSWCYAAHR